MMWKYARVSGLLAVCLLATSVAKASPIALINGDFSSGLSGWTTFTTVNGTLGPSPLPGTESFDVTGGGASDAAKFQIGEVIYQNTGAGGGIFQSFTSGAGSLSLAADIASFASGGDNLAGGAFALLLDSVSVATFDFGDIDSGVTERSTLSALVAVGAGTHEIRLLMTRPYQVGDLGETPFQYVDNVSLDLDSTNSGPVPEPATLLLLGTGVSAVAVRRRLKRRTTP